MTVKTRPTSPNGDARVKNRARKNEPGERPVCRYLGLGDDPETWLAFPSPGNYCHFVEKPAPVDVEHQQTYCLTTDHMACPVFELKNRRRLPDVVAFAEPHSGRRRTAGRLLVLALVIILVLAAATLLLARPSLSAFGIFPATGTPTASAQPTSTPSQATLAATVAPVVVMASDTPSPTTMLSPTPTATPSPSSTATEPAPSATPAPTITQEETTPTPSATPNLPQIVVEVLTLNVRRGPSIDYPIIATIDQNTRYNITGQNNNQDWWLICCLDNNGTPGWVFSESVTVEGAANNIPVVDDIPPLPTEIP